MLSYINRAKLYQLLEKDEQYRQFPYEDTQKNLTVGIGRNLYARGVSHEEALFMLQNDVRESVADLLHNYPFINTLSDARKIVLISMCFNMGIGGLSQFKQMLSALEKGDFQTAAKEMMESAWAKQVGARADRLSHMMEHDLLP